MIKTFLTLEPGEGAWFLLWIAIFPALLPRVWVSLSKLYFTVSHSLSWSVLLPPLYLSWLSKSK